MQKEITSFQNPLIKKYILLSEKSRERKKQNLFTIEGQREISLALKGGVQVMTFLYYSEIFPDTIRKDFKNASPEAEWIQITSDLYEKLAYRTSTEGVLAIAQTKEHSLQDLRFENDTPLVLVAEAPEKPGNIGALLRTADAAHLDAVIIANPRTDLFNPNIIRSSVGCVFTNTVALGSTEEIIAFLKKEKIKIYCAALQASKNYTNCNFSESSAIVVGTEAHGVSNDWLENSDQNIIIPMSGEIDSMNVSVAAGILIFEAKRQRGFN